MSAPLHRHVFETAHGHVGLGWRTDAIVALRLPAATRDESETVIGRQLPRATDTKPKGWVAEAVTAIRDYFDGGEPDLLAIPIDLGRQEPFFARVYAHVREVGRGETTTYGEVARALDAVPEAARTVGQAMARNPIPLLMPCHRVLAAGGRLGGFSAPGGSLAKQRMLELERALAPDPQTSFGF